MPIDRKIEVRIGLLDTSPASPNLMNVLFQLPLNTAIQACPAALLEPLRSSRILVTGATGFFGHWVLRALLQLNYQGFGISVQCTSRQPASFLAANADVAASPDIHWLTGEASQFASTNAQSGTTHILHMAASADARLYQNDPAAAARTIIDGTWGCIELARRTGAHLHLVSSGAVYGSRLRSHGPAREDQIEQRAPDPLNTGHAYGNAKRMAESLVACAGLPDYSISRPFAFVGPMLPLDLHFAAGNFVADASANRPIVIQGDGQPLRSYMHPADLAVWLLACMADRPRGRVLNVGSDQAVSIAELAQLTSSLASSPAPVVLSRQTSGDDPPAYWPSIDRARDLGLELSISLSDSIAQTLAWARQRSATSTAKVS